MACKTEAVKTIVITISSKVIFLFFSKLSKYIGIRKINEILNAIIIGYCIFQTVLKNTSEKEDFILNPNWKLN